MDPQTGLVYTAEEAAKLPKELRARLIPVDDPQQIIEGRRRVKELNAQEAAKKAAKKRSRFSRKRNRK